METELCNMCMITDAQGRVLVQERLPKPSNPWSGLTFPGGHVEPGGNSRGFGDPGSSGGNGLDRFQLAELRIYSVVQSGKTVAVFCFPFQNQHLYRRTDRFRRGQR